MWNKYVVVDFLPPKKFHSQKAARQKMRHGAVGVAGLAAAARAEKKAEPVASI